MSEHMNERHDLSDRDDPQIGDAPEPPELKSETLHGRNFAGASFAANEEEQTADERAGTPESDDIDFKNTVERIQDHGLTD
jgi:hypothetical protein